MCVCVCSAVRVSELSRIPWPGGRREAGRGKLARGGKESIKKSLVVGAALALP